MSWLAQLTAKLSFAYAGHLPTLINVDFLCLLLARAASSDNPGCRRCSLGLRHHRRRSLVVLHLLWAFSVSSSSPTFCPPAATTQRGKEEKQEVSQRWVVWKGKMLLDHRCQNKLATHTPLTRLSSQTRRYNRRVGCMGAVETDTRPYHGPELQAP